MWNTEPEPCVKCGLPHVIGKTGQRPRATLDGLCPTCGGERDLDYSVYCRACKNQYYRGHRPKFSELSPEQKLRSNARAYLRVYIQRGLVKRAPCRVCGTQKRVQAHHTDYSKPLLVEWLCQTHHRQEHHQ